MSDSCASLKAEIAVLRAEIAKLKPVDINAIIKAAEDKILPGVGIIATGIVIQKTEPLNAKIGSFESTLKQMNGAIEGVRVTANNGMNNADLAKNLATQAKNANVATDLKAVKAGIDAANVAKDVGGLKGVVQGFGSKFNELVGKYEKVEKAVGDAVFKAAKAVGISEQALLKVGAVAGRVLELAGAVANILTLIEQLGTLETLGARVDAVEKQIIAVGSDASKALGFIFQLKNQILGIDLQLPNIKDIANKALAGVSRVDFRLTGLSEQLVSVRGVATTAFQKATSAELIANDGFTVARGAATTAQRAEAEALLAKAKADVASQNASLAEKIGRQALGIGGKALQVGGTALTTALTALTIANLVKGLRGIPGPRGLRGLPGRNGSNGLQGAQGLRGLQGFPGTDGVTMVVQVPGQKGDKGDPGKNGIGFPGAPGRDGKAGINGKDGQDVDPVDLAEIKNQLRIIRGQQSAHLAVSVNNSSKLGSQVQGGVSGLLTRFSEAFDRFDQWSKKTQLYSLVTMFITLHNAWMLSNNLGQTLIATVNAGLQAIGLKDSKDQPYDIGTIISGTFENFVKGIIGTEAYTELSQDLAKANRIYQATSNLMSQIWSLSQTITNALEMIASWNNKIGNALKKWGVVGGEAYNWMPENPNFEDNKLIKFLNTANEGANVIQSVVQVPIDVAQQVQSIQQQQIELNRTALETYKDDDNVTKTGKIGINIPEAQSQKATQDAAKTASQPPSFDLSDLFDGDD